MSMLVTGKGGGSGSWIVRGEQLGGAIGARVEARAEKITEDVVIAVKRVPDDLLQRIRASGKPWVLDIVDPYPQPRCSDWHKGFAIAWMRAHIATLKPDGVIWPTQRMAEDVGFAGPSLVLPHHARPNAAINPIRHQVRTVAYEGSPRYLGRWSSFLAKECGRRGWQFVVNPRELADADIVVAFRDAQWSGYCQTHWKSNIKLANAQGTGTPFVAQPECGYRETASGAEYFVDTEEQVRIALDWLEDPHGRQSISAALLAKAPKLSEIAGTLSAWLRSSF